MSVLEDAPKEKQKFMANLDSSLGSYFSPNHQHAEMPLNHLGMEVIHHDADTDLPPLESLDGYRGVFTWFSDVYQVPNPDQHCRWLNKALAKGLKVVILGNPGLSESGNESIPYPNSCQALFRNLGAEKASGSYQEPLLLDVVSLDKDMLEFERKLALHEIEKLPEIKALPGATSLIKIRSGIGTSDPYDPVLISKNGAVALNPFLVYTNLNFDPKQVRWRINPFKFFERAFDLKGWPRPDTTTINGNRIYYSHIDGDGFFNVSEYDRRSWSGEVFIKEILEKYPTLPFTVSLITAYYDKQRFNDEEAQTLSRKSLNLPNVEPASHGYAHPLNWNAGRVAVKIPGYEQDAQKEIVESINFINEKFLTFYNKTSLFLWTGDCLPTQDQLGIAEENEFLNMNGGDTRFDKYFDSYAFVWPLSRKVGPYRQIYSSNSNENTYTNLWEGPFYGFRDVIETFERTEEPRRVKPVNVYMHFYSAEKLSALKALKDIYNWALKQNHLPIFASDYVKLVKSFFDLQITKHSPTHFHLKGGKNIATVRFDDESRIPDLKKSNGVIGYKHFQNNLYVFMKELNDRTLILTEKPQKTPSLYESNFVLRDWRALPTGLAFQKKGWWDGRVVIRGLKPSQSYKVSFGNKSKVFTSKANGFLTADFPPLSTGEIYQEVSIEPTS